MARCIKMGGGGSADTSELTAKAEDVTSGLTFYGNGSDDPQTGTLPHYAYGQQGQTSEIGDMGDGSMWARFKHGRHDTYSGGVEPFLTIDNSKFGNAQTKYVKAGQTFTSSAGFKATGTMPVWPNNFDGCARSEVDTRVFDHGADRFAIIYVGANTCTDEGCAYMATYQPYIRPENIRSGCTIFGQLGTMADYSAGRVVFNYGTFDGTLITGVSPKASFYRYYLAGTTPRSMTVSTGTGTNPNVHIGFNPQNTLLTTGSYNQYAFGLLNECVDYTPFRSISITFMVRVAHVSGAAKMVGLQITCGFYTPNNISYGGNQCCQLITNKGGATGNIYSIKDGAEETAGQYKDLYYTFVIDISDINQSATMLLNPRLTYNTEGSGRCYGWQICSISYNN